MDTVKKEKVNWKRINSTIIGLTPDQVAKKRQIEDLGGSIQFDDKTSIETGLNPEKGTIRLKVSVNGKSQTLYVYEQTLKAILNNPKEIEVCLNKTVGS